MLIVRVETGILDELNAACYQLQRVQGDQPHLLAKTLSIVFRQIWLLISLRSPTIWKSINVYINKKKHRLKGLCNFY